MKTTGGQHHKNGGQHHHRGWSQSIRIYTGGDKATDYGRTIVTDELFQNRYIVGDLGDILISMKEKIESFDEQNTAES